MDHQHPQALGIIGVGHLAGFLVKGISNAKPDLPIILSPRNADKAKSLAANFGARIASNNQDVINNATLIILSVLPSQADTILSELDFKPHQTVISTMAGVSYDHISALAAPARTCCTMMPGLANSLGIGPSILYPPISEAECLLNVLGPVHTFDEWDNFQTASVFGGFSGNTFIFMKQIMDWFIARGLDEGVSRKLVAETLRGNADALLQIPESMDDLITSVATVGGITAEGNTVLQDKNVNDAWETALDAIDNKIKQI